MHQNVRSEVLIFSGLNLAAFMSTRLRLYIATACAHISHVHCLLMRVEMFKRTLK